MNLEEWIISLPTRIRETSNYYDYKLFQGSNFIIEEVMPTHHHFLLIGDIGMIARVGRLRLSLEDYDEAKLDTRIGLATGHMAYVSKVKEEIRYHQTLWDALLFIPDVEEYFNKRIIAHLP